MAETSSIAKITQPITAKKKVIATESRAGKRCRSLLKKYFLSKILQRLPALLSVAITFFFAVMGWVIFAIEDVSAISVYFGRLFGLGQIPVVSGEGVFLLTAYLPLFLLCALASTPIFAKMHQRLKLENPKWLTPATALVLTLAFFYSTAYLVDSTYNPFLYFRF